jgi:chromosome segregation ATPase
MRRTVFLLLGVLEFIVAGVLIILGYQLPSAADVGRSFQGAERVTAHAGNQVRILRRQVDGLRRLELQELAERLQSQTRTVTGTLRTQSIDFDTVRTMRDALGDVAKGLTSLADTLNPATVGQLGNGLGETADFLDQKVVPSAQKAADHLDEATAALRADAVRLAALLRQTPLDLKAVREVHDSLGRFREGLDKMTAVLRLQRLDTMRQGFQGLETSLTTGAEQVERLSGYTYPVIAVKGLKPEVSQRQFWPEGDKIAAGMRKAAAGVTAADKEMEEMAADLPKLRASLTESAKVVDRLREALGVALAQQDKLEPVLKDAPAQAARLAEELPQLGSDLARILRDTSRLKEVAAGLRQAQKGIDTAVARWPEVRVTLGRMATLLNATRSQLDQALQHRGDYETALRQTVLVGETFTAMLPLFTEQIDSRLDEEEQALGDLSESLEEVRAALPVYEQAATNVLQTGRWLAWLVAAIVGLHGTYLVLSVRLGRRFAGV